jgi:hypothetical protein
MVSALEPSSSSMDGHFIVQISLDQIPGSGITYLPSESPTLPNVMRLQLANNVVSSGSFGIAGSNSGHWHALLGLDQHTVQSKDFHFGK